jgi:Secretion system C-terminal sorting domain
MKNIIFVLLICIGCSPLSLNAQCTPISNTGFPNVNCSITVSGNTISVRLIPAGTFCANTDNIQVQVSAPSGTTINSSGGSSVGSLTIPGATGVSGAGYVKVASFYGATNNVQWTSGVAITTVTFTLTGTGTVLANVSAYVETGIEAKTSTCSSNVSLPLDLLTFQAESTGKTALLKWQTASERDFEGFNIERSAEGKTFEKVGFVKSAGTAKGAYSFTDEVPLSGVNYYRLKMMNTDGSFTYSPTRSVVLAEGKTTNVSVVPNPAKEQVYVKLNVQEAKTITLVLVDITGKTLMTERKTLGSGFNELSLSLNNYPQGLYFLKIVDAQTTETHRLVIAK